MIVLVTGDRHWKSRRRVFKSVYKRRKKISLLVQGGADGADFYAKEVATLLGIPTCEYKANWSFHGKAAGPIRNSLMLKHAWNVAQQRKEKLLVLAFHRNLAKSKGTADMVRKAKRLKSRHSKQIIIRLIK